MKKNHTEDFLIAHIEATGASLGQSREDKLANDYLSNKLIDSMGLVGLIMAIEAQFAIELPAEELQSDEFLTVGGLARIIERLQANGATTN